MPENRYFIVTQTREVKVKANTLVDAGRIADAHFDNAEKPDVYGNAVSAIRNTDMVIREDR